MNKTTTEHMPSKKHIPSIPYLGLWVHMLLFGLILSFLSIPQIQSLLEQNQALGESQAQAHIIENATASNAASQNDQTDSLDQSVLETTLLPEDHVVEFIEVFEKAAKDTGVTQAVELTSSKRVVQRGIVNIPVQISLSGSWENIIKFLGQIEQSPFYVNMTAMTMSQQNELSSDYTVNISAITFWKQLL